jgi:hypothetical protein
MNRNFIFVFILLAALSMVNAIPLQKRTTDFGKCPPIPQLPVQPEQISVSISPDPVVPGKDDTFTVTGTLSKDITEDYNLVIGFADLTGKTYGVFVQKMPPTKAKTQFSVTDTVQVPADLPAAYAIGVGVSTLSNPPDVIGCALAVVGGSLPESYPIAL